MVAYRIPFSGRAHNYTQKEMDVVQEAMQTTQPLTQGEYLNQFEAKFVDFQGGKGMAFAVNSATSALELTAQLCQFQSGDEFVIPAHTFTASCYPFIKQGGKPVWADIDLKTRVVTAESIERCLSSKTKAIIVVHLYGYMVDMGAIIELANSRGIILIEDAAQSIGAKYNNMIAGSNGDFGIFSFHSHKNISTLGEGGMLWVKDKKYANIIPMLRHNGHCQFNFDRNEYWLPAMGNVDLVELNGIPMIPNNFCLGEVECALGSQLLKRVDKINAEKRRRALKFIDELDDFPDLEFHKVDSQQHNYHLLVARFRIGKRDKFIRLMAEEYSIQCVVQYYPLNRYDLYCKLGFAAANIPNTDLFFDNMVSFPFQHTLDETELSYMLDSTRRSLKSIGK